MIIAFGKHDGESVIEVVLKNPEYVNWVLENTDATGQLRVIRNEMLRFIDIFNSKPFTQKCWGNSHNCDKPATRCTTHREDCFALQWWCDECNPYQNGASPGTLYVISTYQNVLGYVSGVCKNRKEDYVSFIKRLAQEKGLPKRLKKGDIEKFFLPEGVLTF